MCGKAYAPSEDTPTLMPTTDQIDKIESMNGIDDASATDGERWLDDAV